MTTHVVTIGGDLRQTDIFHPGEQRLILNYAPGWGQNGGTAMAYSYRCKDYPGMEGCPAAFTAETEGELWRHIKLHALEAHQEKPEQWSAEIIQQLQRLIASSTA